MSQEKENKILNIAIDIASNLKHSKYRIASIITDKRNKILSIGWNDYHKTHPMQWICAQKSKNKARIYFHAEIMALVRCREENPYAIYIARVDKKNCPAIAKPCDICATAIKTAGIKKVIFTQ